MITSFTVDDEIIASPESEIFKKEKTAIKKLDLENVKKDFDDAVFIANKFQEEKYSKEIPIKKKPKEAKVITKYKVIKPGTLKSKTEENTEDKSEKK